MKLAAILTAAGPAGQMAWAIHLITGMPGSVARGGIEKLPLAVPGPRASEVDAKPALGISASAQGADVL